VAEATSQAPAKTGPYPYHPGFTYKPALDGIRGVGLIAILAYHGGYAHLIPGSVLSIDAFLVVSGYLITSLLLIEWGRKGGVALKAFWIRRARRLLPALFTVLIGVALYAALLAKPGELDTIRGDSIASLFYVANWRFIISGQSYFAIFGAPSPLRHLWTLAIEEQWYVIWPLLLPGILYLVRGKPKRLLFVILAMAALSALWMAWLFQPGIDPSRVYYGTDTRAQSLLIGAASAVFLFMRPGPRTAIGKGALQLAGIAGGVVTLFLWVELSFSSPALYRGGFALGSLAIAAAIAASVQPGRSPIGSFLSFEPFRLLGLVSYGVYLWHWPIFVVLTPTRTGLDGLSLWFLRVGVSIVVGIVSYHVVEMPFRRGALHGFAAKIAVPAAGAVALVAILFATSSLMPGYNVETASGLGTNPNTFTNEEVAKQQQSALEAVRNDPNADVALLVGDSVALTLGFYYSPGPGYENLLVKAETTTGCGIARGQIYSDGDYRFTKPECETWPDRWQAAVDEIDPKVTVISLGGWELFDRLVDGTHLEFGTPEFEAYIRSELELGLDILTSHGAKVVMVTMPCFEPVDDVLDGWGSERGDPERIVELNDLFTRVVDEYPGDTTVVDLHEFACPASQFDDQIPEPLQYDGVHFSQSGAKVVWDWLGPQVEAQFDHDGSSEQAGPAKAQR